MSIAPPSDRDVDDAPAVAAARGGASSGASGARLSPRATLRGRRSIAYGACREGGDPIILVSGAVADEVVWGPQLRHLRDHRFLAWTPRLPGPGVTLAESLGDLFAICAEEGAARPWIFGWGAGVRWALEAARAFGDRARGVAILSGLGGRGFERLATLAAPLARPVDRDEAPVSAVRSPAPGARRAPRLQRLCEATGIFGPHLAAADADEIAATLAELPAGPTLARALASPSRAALAAAVRVEIPALVLAGDADPLMPAALAQQLGRALVRARVRVLPRGGHFITRELPDYVNLELGRFLG